MCPFQMTAEHGRKTVWQKGKDSAGAAGAILPPVLWAGCIFFNYVGSCRPCGDIRQPWQVGSGYPGKLTMYPRGANSAIQSLRITVSGE